MGLEASRLLTINILTGVCAGCVDVPLTEHDGFDKNGEIDDKKLEEYLMQEDNDKEEKRKLLLALTNTALDSTAPKTFTCSNHWSRGHFKTQLDRATCFLQQPNFVNCTKVFVASQVQVQASQFCLHCFLSFPAIFRQLGRKCELL
jgi:hypothetical protein